MSDLISRQALRDAMYHEAFETDTEMQRWDSGCWIRYKLFENVIDNLPSAERKRGEWRYGENDIGLDGYWCTACGQFVLWNYNETIDFIHRYNYCPNCGARMDEGREA